MSYGYDEPPYAGNLEAFQRARDEGDLNAFERLVKIQYETSIEKQHTLRIEHNFLLGELTGATQPLNDLEALSHYTRERRTVLLLQYEQALLNIDSEEAREELLLYCEGREEYIDVLNSIWPLIQQTLKPQ